MTFRPSAPHKKRRWLALLAVVVLATGAVAGPALADLANATPPSYTPDDQGANDEPGQKDLTAQSGFFHDGEFYTAWKWDNTSWSGKNTGDGCSLFTDDADVFVDYAVCATIGGQPLALQTVTVYSCNNSWEDRCGNPVLLTTFTTTATTYCRLENSTPGQFDGVDGLVDPADTLIICNITAISEFFNPDITALAGAALLNTCSYPSREPNSDPSDCVLEVTLITPALDTESGGTIEWQATLTDEVGTTPAAAGSVVFGLYTDSACTTSAGYTSGSIALDANGEASTSTTVITSDNDPGNGTYYWLVTYTPAPGYAPVDPVCGEQVDIVATVTGSTHP